MKCHGGRRKKCRRLPYFVDVVAHIGCMLANKLSLIYKTWTKTEWAPKENLEGHVLGHSSVVIIQHLYDCNEWWKKKYEIFWFEDVEIIIHCFVRVSFRHCWYGILKLKGRSLTFIVWIFISTLYVKKGNNKHAIWLKCMKYKDDLI